MGLDQYSCKVPRHADNNDFSYVNGKGVEQLAYWRKHPNLEGWMEQTFNRKADAQSFKGYTDFGTEIIATAIEPEGESLTKEAIAELSNKAMNDKLLQELIMTESFASMAANISKTRVFNGQPIRLTIGDLDQLEMHVRLETLPPTTGFFFGDNADKEYFKDDLKFIEEARKAIADGFDVYYESSW